MIHNAADVYESGRLAARLTRSPLGVDFHYLDTCLASGGRPIASTLPFSSTPRITLAGAVPFDRRTKDKAARQLAARRRDVV